MIFSEVEELIKVERDEVERKRPRLEKDEPKSPSGAQANIRAPIIAASLIEDESHFLLSRGLSPEKETKSQPASSTEKPQNSSKFQETKNSKDSKSKNSRINGKASNGTPGLKNGKTTQDRLKIVLFFQRKKVFLKPLGWVFRPKPRNSEFGLGFGSKS